MEGEERPARRRSFLLDTLQFMPQASQYAHATVIEPHIRKLGPSILPDV